MEKAILGTKIGMTQIFGEGGVVIPVTVVMAGPCVVTQKKTVETDGYEAVQVGFGDVKEKHLNKPQLGHFKKADTANKKYVSGISKGKGFAGPMKHGLHRGPMTHGSKSKRVSGSMGMCSNPGRVFKGKVLPGHMGVQKVTVQNLEVVKIDAEQNLILVKGAIPGNKGGLVTIRNSVKA